MQIDNILKSIENVLYEIICEKDQICRALYRASKGL